MNFDKMHEAQLKQLTGCCYAVIRLMETLIAKALKRTGVGRPLKYSVRTMLIVTLIKCRGESAYRTLEVFLGISFVTLHRYTNRVCELLASFPLFKAMDCQYLIVDGSCSRVRSADAVNYSGYKHHKNRKVQMIINDKKRVVSVSKCYPGSVHDKKIWNKEFDALKHLLNRIILGDKGYTGGAGENKLLFRPIKRNEVEYKLNKEQTKAYNRALSKERVKVENVFAQLKSFKILRNLFPLQEKRFGTCFKAIAFVYNMNLDEKARRAEKTTSA